MITRRDFLKLSAATGAVGYLNLMGFVGPSGATPAAAGLADPLWHPMFTNDVPNALDPGFVYRISNSGRVDVTMRPMIQDTGFVDGGGTARQTAVWGYGPTGGSTSWPGPTFVTRSGEPIKVLWRNELGFDNPLPIDESLHWCYSLRGYEQYDVTRDGYPTVPHLHGGHTDFRWDGNPEQFFSQSFRVRGPRWPGKLYTYDNDQPAGTLWYHDHALGVTRLNVYAGLAGFYIVRDGDDTGRADNRLDLPAHPYEVALAIQDRMFTPNGELFYPSYPGEPFYDDFITGEGAVLPPEIFPGGGPSALAEFFGDHMTVNGVLWPKLDVEPRRYRLRLLNGCDSRFLAAQFFEVPAGATGLSSASGPLPFSVIGSDQGLASSPTTVDTLLIETGSRYDVVFDFASVAPGSRVIMKNIGGDEPFGGDLGAGQVFERTDRIMAFDVAKPLGDRPDAAPRGIAFGPRVGTPTRVRKVALFEGKDEFGRLQPLLGTAEPATDHLGNPVNWPDTPAYADVGLVGQMEGGIAWHSPTTENPALGAVEEWEIWNVTEDAHPVHLHLVHFEVLGRSEIVWDSNTKDEERVLPSDDHDGPAGDGTYLELQPVVQHTGAVGTAFRLRNLTVGSAVPRPDGVVENAPKDMVTALPGQVTRIKAHFDRPGRYVWHCHILSHEDHEMMRVLHVGPGA